MTWQKLICIVSVLPLANGYGAATATACRDCHPSEYQLWASSHHSLAERPISFALDSKAFELPRSFKTASQTNVTRMNGGQFQIVALGFRSNVEPYAVERVIGVEPVRQFLTASTNGRWQTQEVSYDPNGNQWFDVYGDEDRRPGEWGHWTGRGMNWNSMCAECHNTRLRKNYDEATDSYHTTMDEISVSCGSCHASLVEHVAWQNGHKATLEKDPNISKPSPSLIVENCGACHSRRDDITGNFVPGNSFFDHFQLQILDDSGAWYADGQVLGEDYEYESFLSSKMCNRGVTCMDCHNPHSAKLILPGNDLCMRCHNGGFANAPVIKPEAHTHHLAANAGNQCVGCHMPVTVYMQRHSRRDHGFTIPDPLLTKELNIPNACNRCHADKTTDWAMALVDQWYGQKMNRATRSRARVIAAGQQGKDEAKGSLADLLTGGNESAYWRAVAAGLLWQWSNDTTVRSQLLKSLKDQSPLVREEAAKSIENFLFNDQEIGLAVKSLLNDSNRNVRVAAAWTLRNSLDTNTHAGRELIGMLDFNADQPIGQYRKAMFELDRGNPTNALFHLRKAEQWDSFSPSIRQRTADVLLLLGKTNEAAQELRILRQQAASSHR